MSGSGRDGVPAETLRSISTPDRVESRLGSLEFRDGAPTKATAELLYDHLDFCLLYTSPSPRDRS